MTTQRKVYEYENVRLIRVIDGDTVELEIDLGNRIWWRDSFRLAGINCPEMSGDTKIAGDAAKIYLEKLLQDGIRLVRTDKPDKFGRWLVTIYNASVNESINSRMVLRGHAVPYDGGSRG